MEKAKRSTKKKTNYFIRGKNDEYNTPEIAYNPIRYLSNFLFNKTIWDPFVSEKPTAKDRIKKMFPVSKEVIHDRTFDLLTFKLPERFDIIITNPPFSKKKEIIQQLFILDKPFCCLLPFDVLSRKYMMVELQTRENLHVILPSQRFDFESVYEKETDQKKKKSTCPFSSIWLCYKCPQPNNPHISLFIWP